MTTAAPRGTPPRAVALDGLSGVGKSTVARRVAAARGWEYLDTGASYRAMTLAALQSGVVEVGTAAIPPPMIANVLAAVTAALPTLALSTRPESPGVRLAGVDRSRDIRSESVTSAVSAVSAVPAVRALLVRWQRAQVLASAGMVVEGRDIGTVVLPDAPLKVWLTADAGARAARRAGDRHTPTRDLAQVRSAVDRRDALDVGRVAGPARPAPDAVLLDTTGLDVERVSRTVLDLMQARGLGDPRAADAR